MTTSAGGLSLEIDQEAGAAYLQFSDQDVTRSVEFSDAIIVDLDVHNVVIGIEILDLKRSVPLDELVDKFHVRTEALATLMQALRLSTPSGHLEARASVAAPTFGSVGARTSEDLTIA